MSMNTTTNICSSLPNFLKNGTTNFDETLIMVLEKFHKILIMMYLLIILWPPFLKKKMEIRFLTSNQVSVFVKGL